MTIPLGPLTPHTLGPSQGAQELFPHRVQTCSAVRLLTRLHQCPLKSTTSHLVPRTTPPHVIGLLIPCCSSRHPHSMLQSSSGDFLTISRTDQAYSYHTAFDSSLETSSGSSPFLYSYFCPDMPPRGFTNTFVYFVFSSSSLPTLLLIFLLFFGCSETDSCCVALLAWNSLCGSQAGFELGIVQPSCLQG